jgi:uncharacterized membrane protein
VSLTPLLSEPAIIQVHAFAAIVALVLGVVQFAMPKGTLPHRTTGWIWVAAMATVALSSFWVHTLNVWGPWSPIHILSIVTLVLLPIGVFFARRRNVRGHRSTMIGLYAGGLVIAGLFTLLPGRVMHEVLFGIE